MKKDRFGKITENGCWHSFLLFETIISAENIFAAWREFQKGKMSKIDVLEFSDNSEENLFNLIADLKNGTYVHGQYIRFCVHDPKRREIAKALVRDRVLHHAVHRVLGSLFDKSFIFDSFSSRKEKGTHAAVKRLAKFAQKLSENQTKTVWVLQIDIKKFFDSVDHEILVAFLKKKILDEKVISLLEEIVKSFDFSVGKGIPLGNLTSQLFSNVYLDPLDQFIKRRLGVKYYLRYADDMVILSRDKILLENYLLEIQSFVAEKLKLQIHPNKIFFRKWHQGVDFLGYVSFSNYAILRTKTKRRALKKIYKEKIALEKGKITKERLNQTVQSYFGILKHCRGHEIQKEIENIFQIS